MNENAPVAASTRTEPPPRLLTAALYDNTRPAGSVNDTDPVTFPDNGSATPATNPRDTGAATTTGPATAAAVGADTPRTPGRTRPKSPNAADTTTHDNGDCNGEPPPPNAAKKPDKRALTDAFTGTGAATELLSGTTPPDCTPVGGTDDAAEPHAPADITGATRAGGATAVGAPASEPTHSATALLSAPGNSPPRHPGCSRTGVRTPAAGNATPRDGLTGEEPPPPEVPAPAPERDVPRRAPTPPEPPSDCPDLGDAPEPPRPDTRDSDEPDPLDAEASEEPAEPTGSAKATGINATAEPTPKATANAPTRPT